MSYLDIIRHRKLNTWSIPSCWFSCQTCSTHVNSISVAGIILTSHIKNFKSKISNQKSIKIIFTTYKPPLMPHVSSPHALSHLQSITKPISSAPNTARICPLLTVSTATILLQAISTSHPLPILPASNLSPPSHSPPRSYNDLFQKRK